MRMSTPSTDASGLGELRQRNRLRVLAALRRGRSLSQADISRATALSRTTVSSVIRDLKREGLVQELGPMRPGVEEGGRERV